MTTEDDFHRALDAHPGDWQTRLVFADFLDERGDARAEGYRALGRGLHQTDTTRTHGIAEAFHWWDRDWTDRVFASYPAIFRPVSLAGDWYRLVEGVESDGRPKRDFLTRRAAEDAAAVAFAKLPPVRRAELLVVPPEELGES